MCNFTEPMRSSRRGFASRSAFLLSVWVGLMLLGAAGIRAQEASLAQNDPEGGGTSIIATSAVGFGHVTLGAASGVIQALSFTVPPGTSWGAIHALTLGVPNLDFTVVGGPTCTTGTADTTCTVNVQFLPTAPGLRRGAVVVYDNATPPNPLVSIPLYGSADAPVAALAPHSGIVVSTGGVSTLSPFEIALDGVGNMFVGNLAGNNVVELPASGGTANLVSVPGEPLSSVTGVALDGAGNIFIADEGHSRIVVLTPGGIASGLSINGLNPGLLNPYALAFDAAGNLYIADSGNARVVKVSFLAVFGPVSSGEGSVINTGDFTLGPVTGVAAGPGGTLLIADPTNDRVLQITAAGAVSLLIPSEITLSNPQGVGVDPMGNVYIADSGNNRIVEVTTAGVASVVSTPGLPSPSTLDAPAGVTVDSSGNIFIADSNNNRVVEVPASEAKLEFPSTKVGLTSPWQAATITNLGNQPLVFAANPDDPPNFSEHSSDPNLCTSATKLSAGTACDVSMEFTPHVAGNLSASLTRRTNALNLASATQQVTLSGLAAGPPDTTATAVSINPSPITIGQTSTLTATVTDTTAGKASTVPTGQVTFTDTVGSSITSLNDGLGVNLNASGQASLTGVVLRGTGLHTISAVYSGISNTFLTSTGVATVTVNQAPSTLTLPTAAVVTFGQTNSIAATVSGPYATITAPSGTVSYSILNASNASVASGTVSLTVGNSTRSTASIPLNPTLPPGSYTVSATYSGDSNYSGVSTASTFALTVNKANLTVSLVSSLNPVFVTNAVTFTATVSSSAATPTGSISFFDGLTLLVSVPLAQGMATYTTSGLAIGTHTITASYSGDTNFAALTSSAVAQLVIDFSVGASTPVGQPYPPIVLPGASTSYTILATPTRGANFPSPVTFSISGLPAGATAVFTPTTVPAGSAATNVTLSVQLAHQILAHHPVKPLGGGLALAMMGGMLLLPFARKLAASGGPARRVACLLLLVLAVAGAALGLTGCAAPRSGYFGQKEVNYTMTVTATSGALSHTTTVALTVE